MPTQIESHRLHLQVRHVQLLRAKCWQEKNRKKSGTMFYAQMSYELTMKTPGEKGKYMLMGSTSFFSLFLSKIKIRAKTFYGQS